MRGPLLWPGPPGGSHPAVRLPLLQGAQSVRAGETLPHAFQPVTQAIPNVVLVDHVCAHSPGNEETNGGGACRQGQGDLGPVRGSRMVSWEVLCPCIVYPKAPRRASVSGRQRRGNDTCLLCPAGIFVLVFVPDGSPIAQGFQGNRQAHPQGLKRSLTPPYVAVHIGPHL